jgi:GNAT superfamily N-acetyltransferase
VELTIRLASIEDLPAVSNMDYSIIKSFKRKDEIVKSINKEECLLLIEDGIAVGFLVFSANFFGKVFIELLIIEKEKQNKGYGSKFLSLFESYKAPIEELFTSTNCSNISMKKLLIENGYIESGIVNNLDVNDAEIIFYKKMNYKGSGIVYLGLKYRTNNQNKDFIEKIDYQLNRIGMKLYCIEKDLEIFGKNDMSPSEMMKQTFHKIDESEIVLIDVTEKGIGLGIECGYAYSIGKPLYIIIKNGYEVSKTINGIATKILEYENIQEITALFRS